MIDKKAQPNELGFLLIGGVNTVFEDVNSRKQKARLFRIGLF